MSNRTHTAATKFLAWAKRPRQEASNSIVMFVFLLPIVLGAFGMGLDFSRNAYIRVTIQNNLDLAAVAGAGTAEPDGNGQIVLPTEAAQAALEENYDINRRSLTPYLDCATSGAKVGTTGRDRCWKIWRAPVMTNNSINYSIVETSRNAFLSTVGFPTQEHHITASARVVQDTQ